jgi:hypothetical protein
VAKGAQDPRRKSFQASGAQSIPLSHAAEDPERHACNTEGPYDVVLMDMTLSRLLHALLQARGSLPLFFPSGPTNASFRLLHSA